MTVPQYVTVHWAVGEAYNSSTGLSTALLRGDTDQWAETKAAGQSYKEHYLCPDASYVMSAKGEALRQGQWNPPQDHWLLQPKLAFASSLTGILAYLQAMMPGQLDVFWTCCRSPINQQAQGKVEFVRGPVLQLNSILQTDRLGNAANDPFTDPKIRGVKTINGVNGAVTLKNKMDGALNQDRTWPCLLL